MTLLFGTAFLMAALLTCVVPISLLIAFAAYFSRTARRLPPNATPVAQAGREETQIAAERQFPESQA